MDRERVALTAHELRVLVEVETSLRRDHPELDVALSRHGTGAATDWRRRGMRRWRRLSPVVAAAGALVLFGGLAAGLVAVASAGFVVMVVGSHAMSLRRPGCAPWGRRAWVALGLAPGATESEGR